MLDTHARHLIQPLFEKTANALLRTGLSPNHVTFIAGGLGFAAGVLVYFEHSWWALGLLWLSGFLDAVDGTMARLSNRSSAWGTLLDVTLDRIVELAVIVALAARFQEAQFGLLVLTASIVVAMTIFLTVGALSEKKGVKSFYYQAGLAERTEGFVMLSLMVAWPQLLMYWTILFIALEWFTSLQRLAEARRLLKE